MIIMGANYGILLHETGKILGIFISRITGKILFFLVTPEGQTLTIKFIFVGAGVTSFVLAITDSINLIPSCINELNALVNFVTNLLPESVQKELASSREIVIMVKEFFNHMMSTKCMETVEILPEPQVAMHLRYEELLSPPVQPIFRLHRDVMGNILMMPTSPEAFIPLRQEIYVGFEHHLDVGATEIPRQTFPTAGSGQSPIDACISSLYDKSGKRVIDT